MHMSNGRVEQHEIDVLMAFNSAVVTSRLYPASAPQVKNSLERGFKALTEHLESYDTFSIGLVSGVNVINQKGVEQEVLDGLTNLVIFRQLGLLEIPAVFFEKGIDLFSFNQIVSVFIAKKEKIKREGGGREFVANLGLISFFPESIEACVTTGKRSEETEKKVTVKTDTDLLAALFGRTDNSDVLAQLHEVLNKTESSVDILVAGIGKLLVVLSKKKAIGMSSDFSELLQRVDSYIVSDSREEIIKGTCAVLASNLQVPALTVLLAQDFVSKFGEELYDGFIAALDDNSLKNLVALYRKYASELENKKSSTAQFQIVVQAAGRLQSTRKVQLLLGKEKAEEIIVRGEVERLKNRLNNSVKAILQGDFSRLSSSEFVRQLPQIILSLAKQDNQTGLTLITILSQKLVTLQGQPRQELAISLILTSQSLIAEKKWSWLHPLIDSFLYWLKNSTTPDSVYEQMAVVVYNYMVEERRAGLYDRADKILNLFYKIRSGEISKSGPVKALIGRVQDRSIDRKSLPSMLVECLENPNDEQLSRRLALQGPIVARYLIDALISSEKTEHRLKILDLLIYNGTALAPIIVDRLNEHMAWYGKRNLIKLLGDSGDVSHAEVVLEYISHEDLRVQREAFICLGKISGDQKKPLFLRALDTASETIRVQLIRSLEPIADEEVVKEFCRLLKEYSQVTDRDVSVVVTQLIRVLSSCPFIVVASTLKDFIAGRRGRYSAQFDEGIWDLAEEALAQVESNLSSNKKKKNIQISQLRKSSQRQATRVAVAGSDKQKSITDTPEEQHIRMLFDRGSNDKAVQDLLALIEKFAKARSFVQAEKLRNWMIEVAPTMLTEIIRAAEIIEEEKSTSIDKEHLEVWSDLYDVLTTEEFSTLYHYLKHKTLSPDQLIVNQGDNQKSLFFINSGTIRLFYTQNGSETFIKSMGQGMVLGAGSFFDASVWTVSASSMGRSEISILNLEDIKGWVDDYPALESKLQDFCYKFEKVDDFFKKSARDRRVHDRINISGRLTAHLLDSQGKPTGVMPKGDLADISGGGISFTIRLTRKSNARILLGRKIRVMLPGGGEQEGTELAVTGDVLAVRSQQSVESEYSVHIKFDEIIEAGLLKKIVVAMNRKAQ